MSNQLQALVKYRALSLNDINFIYASWLKSYRQSEFAKDMPNDVFFTEHKEIINTILNNPNTSVHIICNPEDVDQVYGYLVEDATHQILHFAYIKYNYRHFHLMSTLLSTLGYTSKVTPTFITHIPRHYDIIKEKYNLVYNPYLLIP